LLPTGQAVRTMLMPPCASMQPRKGGRPSFATAFCVGSGVGCAGITGSGAAMTFCCFRPLAQGAFCNDCWPSAEVQR
jgi:hypothetical protein